MYCIFHFFTHSKLRRTFHRTSGYPGLNSGKRNIFSVISCQGVSPLSTISARGITVHEVLIRHKLRVLFEEKKNSKQMEKKKKTWKSQQTILFSELKNFFCPLFNIWKMGSQTPSLIVRLEPFAIFSHLLWPFQPAGGKIILFCCNMRQKSGRTEWIHIRTSDESDLVAMSQAVSPAPLRSDLRAPNLIKSESWNL